MQLFLLPSGCSCCHVAVHHILICSYSFPLLECGYSCYHPVSPCHHMAILAAVWLFLPSCNCSCCPSVIPATMWLFFAAMQPLIVALWLFLLPCRYSCHNVAIFAAMQPLIVAMWIYFCCNASYSRHHEAILAALQLFLPQ